MDETLLETVVQATGFPKEEVMKQLRSWLKEAGKNPDNPTLDDLREALASVLQDLFKEVAAGENDYISLSG